MIENLKKIGFCEIKVLDLYGWLNTGAFPNTIYIPVKKIREVKDFTDKPHTHMGRETVDIDYPTFIVFNFDEDEDMSDKLLPFGDNSENGALTDKSISFYNIGWSDLSVEDFNKTFKDTPLKDKEIELVKYDFPLQAMKNKQLVKIEVSDILYIEKVSDNLTMVNEDINTDFNYSSLIWTYSHEEQLFSELTPEELIAKIAE